MSHQTLTTRVRLKGPTVTGPSLPTITTTITIPPQTLTTTLTTGG